ncbi:hypothetical protein DBV05_g9282 [Lasiodiplodia theobromae]|uniref:Uncharacterized protein n=1 Tax=Lasiodiplodia theobromae TaxID=45133 RepID=A0A5N5D2X5_9PEZI|nr:hypothetical protein DBV05_g9282 [Lasiodiplodia theobromae]
MPDFDPKDNVRNPDLQDLYDALDIHPDDQPVFDVFREELFDKLLDASEQQRRGGNADNHGSQSVTTDDTAAADFMIRRITYEIEEATDEDEEDKDEEDILVLARGSPPPNSWAKVKPGPEYGELHFPGHANYTDNEIPITGDHGFMLLHRRPRFKTFSRYLVSKDHQELDQLAMTTLHYIDNSELRIQTESYTREEVDFTKDNHIRKLEYWVKRFLIKHGANPRLRRAEQHSYLEEEREWIRRTFEQHPSMRLGELCRRFNAYWGGREVPGVGKRPTRTNGALMNEVYRSDLKQKKVPQLRSIPSRSQSGGVGGMEIDEEGQEDVGEKMAGEEKAPEEKAHEEEIGDEKDGEYEIDEEYLENNGTAGDNGHGYQI